MVVGNGVAGADTRGWTITSAFSGRLLGLPSISLRWVEIWAADLLLTCKVGQAFDDSRDKDVRYFLERRSDPIGAAIAASITLPAE